jgi:aryl-alcohol dehydrogenase-like predicted oxidoreductase
MQMRTTRLGSNGPNVGIIIDTADAYVPYTNEALVGRALPGGYRQRAILATKVGAVTATEPGVPTGLSFNGRPEHIRASIDASLRRLGADFIDLYQLHRVDPRVPIEDTWGAPADDARRQWDRFQQEALQRRRPVSDSSSARVPRGICRPKS